MEVCYSNSISKIRNVLYIFENFYFSFIQNRNKKIEKIRTDSEKSTNLFDIKMNR